MCRYVALQSVTLLKVKIKVTQLKEICFLFGIEIEGPAGGNTLYVKPLEDLVQACSVLEKRLEDFDSKPD